VVLSKVSDTNLFGITDLFMIGQVHVDLSNFSDTIFIWITGLAHAIILKAREENTVFTHLNGSPEYTPPLINAPFEQK
jgi:hypothetical protein